jgi:hypothetical protein
LPWHSGPAGRSRRGGGTDRSSSSSSYLITRCGTAMRGGPARLRAPLGRIAGRAGCPVKRRCSVGRPNRPRAGPEPTPAWRTGARCSPDGALRPGNARTKHGAEVGRRARPPFTYGGDPRVTPIPRMPAAPSILPRSMARSFGDVARVGHSRHVLPVGLRRPHGQQDIARRSGSRRYKTSAIFQRARHVAA